MNPSKLTPDLVNQIITQIATVDMPRKVIIFGSYAYGDPTEDSDLDVLVIKDQVQSRIKESMRIRKALRGIRLAKDIIVTTQEKFDFYKNECGSVFKDINEKGVVIYG